MIIVGLGVNNRIGRRGSLLGGYNRGPAAPPAAPTVSGTISNQSVQQGTGVVTYSTAGAFTGSGITYSLTGGAAGITINPSTGVVSVDRAVVAVSVYSLTVRATNVSGFAETGFTLTVAVATLTLRQQIEGLSTQVTPNGRQSVAVLQVASPGNLPPGCSLAANVMTFSGNGITLEDWNFGGYSLRISGTGQTVQNCTFGPYEAAGSNDSPIQLEASSVNAVIRYNTVDGFDGYGGPVAHIKIVTTGSGAAATGSQNYLIEYNRFLFPQSDVIKCAGNGIVQWNYFGPLTNYPTGTSEWAAGVTYSAGQYVLSPVNASLALFRSDVSANIGNSPPSDKSGTYSAGKNYAAGDSVRYQSRTFVSISSGNVGNTPPSSSVDNAFWAYNEWESLDPHGDCITQTASDGVGVIIRRNLIDWGPAITRAVGTTQAIRIIRNNKSSVMMGPVDFSENVIPGPYDGFHTVSTNHVAETYVASRTYAVGDLLQSGVVYYTSLSSGNIGNTPATSPTFWEVTVDINAPGPIRYLNNWIGAGSLGSYFNPPMANAVDAWSNNVDSVTDALIAGPVLRVNTTPLIASVIGQSENEIGFAKNNVNSTSGPYPALLSGVDARIALHATSDDTGVAVLRTLDAAAITAKTVSPGFVGMANLWHIGSGGRPLRLVADVVSGTSMTDMMDDVGGDGREFSASAALVSLAQGAWGTVSRVVYNWWNAEASAAKTLWTSRSAHFFGVNSDNSPYDFTTGPLEHCLIDITNRGYGLLSSTAKLDLMLPGVRIETATQLRNPPNLNYRTNNIGGEIFGMIDQNSYESYLQRDNVLTQSPVENQGNVTISPALVRFGDYVGGVQLAQPSQSSIHPSLTHKDGQILFSQDVASHFLIAENHAQVSTLSRVVQSADRTTFDFVFDIPLGGTLTTQRILDAETVASPRPHQQQVMGFVIARGADTDRQMRPLYRTDNVDGVVYPIAYRGTATITNTGVDVTLGLREATVRVVLSSALAVGDRIHFGTDGGYGGFGLHGYTDYDANLYRDGLRVYEPRLDDGSATRYPGIPVRAQRIHTVIAVADTVAPVLSGVSVSDTSTTATLSWSTSDSDGVAYWLVDTNATRTPAQVITAANVVSVTASGVQPTIMSTGLAASTSYYFHIIHVDAAGNQSTVSSTSFMTEAVAGPNFGFAATGPLYTAVATIGAMSEATANMRIRIDSTSGFDNILTINGANMSLRAWSQNRQLQLSLNDSASTVMAVTTTATNVFPLGVFFDLKVAWDLVALRARIWVDGVLVLTGTVTAGTGVHGSVRKFSFGASSGGAVGALESLDIWQIENADGSLPVSGAYLSLDGPAATAEANTAWVRTGTAPT